MKYLKKFISTSRHYKSTLSINKTLLYINSTFKKTHYTCSLSIAENSTLYKKQGSSTNEHKTRNHNVNRPTPFSAILFLDTSNDKYFCGLDAMLPKLVFYHYQYFLLVASHSSVVSNWLIIDVC